MERPSACKSIQACLPSVTKPKFKGKAKNRLFVQTGQLLTYGSITGKKLPYFYYVSLMEGIHGGMGHGLLPV